MRRPSFGKGRHEREEPHDKRKDGEQCQGQWPQHTVQLNCKLPPLNISVPITTEVVVEWLQCCPSVEILDLVAGEALRRAILLRKNTGEP